MKLAIVTPVARSSAISAISSVIIRGLTLDGHHVAVIASESVVHTPDQVLEFPSSPVHFSSPDAHETLATSDVVVYQVSNHYPDHEGAITLLDLFPGVVCLHDFFLGDLFAGWAARNRLAADDVLDRWYGSRVQQRFWKWQRDPSGLAEAVASAPMTEWICSKAVAVFTHSGWGIERVLGSCPGSVWSFPLCHPKTLPAARDMHVASMNDHVRRRVILTFGHIVINKCVEVVIDAIGWNRDLMEAITYRVVGPVATEYRHSLADRATKRGVRIEFTGEVTDDQLMDEIARADVVVALRWPATAAASASVIEALWSGKPTVVTDTGWYRELPDDVVYKISVAGGPKELSDRIRSLLLHTDTNDRQHLARMQFAHTHFNCDTYYQNVQQFITNIYPSILTQNAMRIVIHPLREWQVCSKTINVPQSWKIFSHI